MSEAPSSAPAASAAPAVDTTQQTPEATDTIGTAATEVAEEASPVEEPAQEEGAELTAAEQKQVEKAIAKEIKKWKLKSNGKEREVTDEAEMIRLAQLGLGANEKFEQAAKTRKEAEQVIQLLQTNPGEALKRLGFDLRKLSEDYLFQELQNEKLTPEQKKMKEMETELERYKKEKEDITRKQEEAHIEKLTKEYETTIQNDIIKAIDQYKLPNNPRTVARIAEYMAKALDNGISVDPLDVAPRVRADLEQEHKAMYSQYSVEDILKLIGDDKAKAIRQYEVQKVKAKAPVAAVKTESVQSAPKAPEEDKKSKPMTLREMMEQIEKEIQ